MSKWVVPLLSELSKVKPHANLFLGLATIENGNFQIKEDPQGFLRSLGRMSKKSSHHVFYDCVECARKGELLGDWRFFVVEEVYMGTRQIRLMATYVAYRARSTI